MRLKKQNKKKKGRKGLLFFFSFFQCVVRNLGVTKVQLLETESLSYSQSIVLEILISTDATSPAHYY